MKKTSYIIIALAIFPVVMVFLSPFIASLYSTGKYDRYMEYDIRLSSKMAETKTADFEAIDIENFFPRNSLSVIVRRSDSCRILVPENIVDWTTIKMDGPKLKVEAKNQDDKYHYLDGDTLLIIEMPQLPAIRLSNVESLRIEGFGCDYANIDFPYDIYLRNCQIGNMKLIDAGALILSDSRVGHADVVAESYLRVETKDARIDSMVVSTSKDRLSLTCGDANIGNLQLLPNGRTISLNLKEPFTLNNVGHGIDD